MTTRRRRRERLAPGPQVVLQRRESLAPGPQAALEIATRFLSVRPRSRHELEARLRRAGADDAVIGQTLTRLGELGLVDDMAFARWWLAQRDQHAPRGRRLLEAELRRHGIGGEILELLRDEAAGRVPEPANGITTALAEEQRARMALARHLRGRPLPIEPRGLQRIGMFLVRRGFDPEVARAALMEVARDGGPAGDSMEDGTGEGGEGVQGGDGADAAG